MCVKTVHRILLGLLMLIPGLVKLFVATPTGVTGMLSGLGFPAAMFFAWILIISEIVFGIAILANWKIKYTVWPPIVILAIAVLTTTPWMGGKTLLMAMPNLILHLVAITGYWMLSGIDMHSSHSKK